MKRQLLLLVFSAASTIGFAQIPNYVPPNDLVGYWPFTNNANDVSTNANNGTNSGATLTTDRFGNANSAYNFDGVNDTIKLSFQQTNVTAYSISAWFKSTDGGAILAGRGSSSQVGLTLHLHSQPTGVTNVGKVMYVADGNTESIGKLTDASYDDGNWHHVVAVFNGTAGGVSPSQFSIYIDNVLVSQSNSNTGFTTAPISNSTDLLIGAHQAWTNGGLFNGVLDDIGIWSRALNTQEISDLYNANICYQSVSVTDTLVMIMNITGFNPITYGNSVKIYPNPTSTGFVVDYGDFSQLSGYTLKVFNATSQEVFSSSVNQQTTAIDASGWATGVYTVQLIDAATNAISTKKLVIQ